MEFKHPNEDYTNSDIELKTPRRSLRLKSNTNTPSLNISTVKKALSIKGNAKLTKAEFDVSSSDSISIQKEKSQQSSGSSAEEKQGSDIKGKGKRRKGKKSRKNRNKSKNLQLANTDNGSDKDILNVTFDKLSSSNNELENEMKDKNISLNITKNKSQILDQKSKNDLPSQECNLTESSSEILLNKTPEIQSSESFQDLLATEELVSTDDRKDILPEEKRSSIKEVVEQKVTPVSKEYINLQVPNETEMKENLTISLNSSGIKLLSNMDTNSIEEQRIAKENINLQVPDEIETKENLTMSLNSSGIKPLSDTDTTSIEGQRVDILQGPLAKEYILFKNVSDESGNNKDLNTSMPSEKKLCDIQSQKENKSLLSLSFEETKKDQVNFETSTNIINLDVSNNKNSLQKTPKTPLLQRKIEKLVSSTPIMRPIKATITPKSVKRLKPENITNSSVKSIQTKSVTNRVSTPFHKQGKSDKMIDSLKLINATVAQEILSSSIVTPMKTGEKVDEPLRSIRKRSLSESVRSKKGYRVTFHSPSNIEIPIREVEKEVISKENKSQESNLYVTQRRKRSLSVTETESEKRLAFANMDRANEDLTGTPSKMKKLPVQTSRTKMPNFAAIHNQKFQKMESIADHVARKAERAKALTSSTNKTGSSIKVTQMKDDLKKNADTKPLTAVNKTTNKNYVVSKARQKIDLSHVEVKKVPAQQSVSKAISTTEPAADIVKSRQKKNMELYKNRPQFSQKDQQTKRQEIVKGVRSNRRFELQMMIRHRVDQ